MTLDQEKQYKEDYRLEVCSNFGGLLLWDSLDTHQRLDAVIKRYPFDGNLTKSWSYYCKLDFKLLPINLQSILTEFCGIS